MSVLDKLLNKQEQVNMPVEGEQFPTSGFIGPVRAKMLWNFGSDIDLAGPEYREDVPQPFYREQFPGSGRYNYFYADPNSAKVAAQVDSNAFNPQQVWYWEMKVPDIININTEAFQSNSIARSCRVNTLRSNYRHEFHMVTLPSVVAAVAKLMGYDTPGYDLTELLVRDTVVTDEMSRRLIGGLLNEDKDGKVRFTAPYYQESELWEKRAALWEALGEEDPAKYTVDALKPNSTKPANSNTEAKKLQELLGLYINPWDEALWVRFAMATDPRVGAVTKSGRALTLPVVVEAFGSEKEAQAAAKADAEKFGKEDGGGEVKVDRGDMPPVPEGWDEGEWIAEITPFLDMKKVAAKRAFDPEDYEGATFEDVWAWVEWEKSK